MRGDRQDGGFHDVASWLEQQERRLQSLEAENRELHRQLADLHLQLADLRRGAGIAVVIEGRMMALVPAAATEEAGASASANGRAQTGPGPATASAAHPFAQSEPGAGARTLRTVAAGAGISAPSPAARGARPVTGGPPPDPTRAASSPRGGYAPRERAPERRAFPPLAATPEQLPGTAPLSVSTSEWLRSGASWPDAAAIANGATLPMPSLPALPPAATPGQGHPLPDPRDRERPRSERNPFADSFIL
jgi:hypothetical protein